MSKGTLYKVGNELHRYNTNKYGVIKGDGAPQMQDYAAGTELQGTIRCKFVTFYNAKGVEVFTFRPEGNTITVPLQRTRKVLQAKIKTQSYTIKRFDGKLCYATARTMGKKKLVAVVLADDFAAKIKETKALIDTTQVFYARCGAFVWRRLDEAGTPVEQDATTTVTSNKRKNNLALLLAAAAIVAENV